MSIFLLTLLALCMGTEVLLATCPRGHQGTIAYGVFAASLLAVFLCSCVPWLCCLPAVGCIVTCFYKPKASKLVTAVLATAIALVIVLMPGTRELLYLERRYPDVFTFIEEGVFYSAALDCNILADASLGDTYQSALYSARAISECVSALPHGTEIISVEFEEQQTGYFARSYEDYMQVLSPSVYIQARIPEQYTNLNIPAHCVLENIS